LFLRPGTGNFIRPDFINAAIDQTHTHMQLPEESVLLAILLVAGGCIIGILLREIYLMRKELKIEMGTKSRQQRKPGKRKETGDPSK
jgi:hypothetical protein